MPRGQPFTAMCAALARPPFAGQADLHGHTTASDGTWSPGRYMAEARKAGLAWVAITDPIPGGATILGGGLGRDSQIATQGEKKASGAGWPAFEERSFESDD